MQLQKIKSIRKRKIGQERLWNLAVEGDESFVANKIVVHNCRSIWVEILKEEEFKPKFNKIPKSIPANRTIQTHVPMLKPSILKNSPAIGIINDELKERKNKLSSLEKSGKFPNRQKAHKKRIKQLESSLKGKFAEYIQNVLVGSGINFTNK